MKIDFSGRVAIVTGAGNGLGRSHALALAERGAKVVVNDLGGARDGTGASSVAADEVVGLIEAVGGEAFAHGANVAEFDEVDDMVAQTMSKWGRVDILVNNAGILRDKSFSKMDLADFKLVMDVHLMGSVNCSKAVWDIMRLQNYGRIVMTTSASGMYGNFGQTNYAAAKGAIASMTYTWAIELAKYGIRVNAIGPTGTTRMSDTFTGSKNSDDIKYPYIDPTLNGPLIAFLSSDQASNISGQIFGCGGDRLALMVQPHYGKTLTKEGGWSLEEIKNSLPKKLIPEFGNLGMLSKPYPFLNGVVPTKK